MRKYHSRGLSDSRPSSPARSYRGNMDDPFALLRSGIKDDPFAPLRTVNLVDESISLQSF